MKSKPTFRDWALAGGSVLFVLMGIFILPTDRNLGITTTAFFGACALVHIRTVLRKLRESRFRKGVVRVVGGVPIRASRAKALAMGAIVFGLGVILIVFDDGKSFLMLGCAWLIALAGCVLLVAVMAGLMPAQYLQFGAEGIIFGYRKWSVLVPWDRISNVSAGEWASNSALFLWFDFPEGFQVRPAGEEKSFMKLLGQNRAWIGADMFLLTEQYDMDLPVLVQAIERYCADPASRAELM